MEDILVEPLVLFLGVLGILAALFVALAMRRAASRASTIGEIRRAAAAGEAGEVVRVHADGGKGGPWLAVVEGSKIAVADREAGGPPPSPHEVKKATFLQDDASRTGLRLETDDGRSFVVSDLDGAMRAYGQLAGAGVGFNYQFAPGGGDRIKTKIDTLHAKEQQILAQWLIKDEILLDAVPNAEYSGTLQSGGTAMRAILIVTNLRVGLLAQTQTTTVSGNTRTVTTHYNLLGYPFPLIAQVDAKRDGKLRSEKFTWSFQYKPETPPPAGQKPPDLILDADQAAVMLPLSICGTPLSVRDAGVGVGGLIGSWILGGIGFGIIGGVVGFVPFWAYWGTGGLGGAHWMEDWLLTVLVGSVAAGAIIRGLSALEHWFERKADRAMLATS